MFKFSLSLHFISTRLQPTMKEPYFVKYLLLTFFQDFLNNSEIVTEHCYFIYFEMPRTFQYWRKKCVAAFLNHCNCLKYCSQKGKYFGFFWRQGFAI
jgi:hypothetical protein